MQTKKYSRAIFTLIAFLAFMPLAQSQETASGTALVEKPAPANSFVDAIGIHSAPYIYTSTYSDFSDWSPTMQANFFTGVFLPRLQELGIRHFRHFLMSGNQLAQNNGILLQDLNQLAAANIHMNVAIVPTVINSPQSFTQTPLSTSDQATINNIVTEISNMGPVVESVEGLNEFDEHIEEGSNPLRFNNAGIETPFNETAAVWVPQMYNFCKAYYDAIKHNPSTHNLTVLGPTFTGYASSTAPPYGTPLPSLKACADLGTIHDYWPPYWTPVTPTSPTTGYVYITSPYKDMPLVASETGFNTSTSTVLGSAGVSQVVQAQYLLRQQLDFFSQAFKKIYIYDLIDLANNKAEPQSNFGLLDHSGKPKTAFNAEKNLLSLISDQTPSLTVPGFPQTLSYNLQSNNGYLRHLLLQKNNGDYYLILWLRTPNPQTANITLTLPKVMSGILFDPVTASTPITSYPIKQWFPQTTFNFGIANSPLVLRLIPYTP